MDKSFAKNVKTFSCDTYDVITLLSDCISLEMSLQLRFCKFCSSISKYGSNVVKTVAKIALRNLFSVSCNNVQEITDQRVQVNINERHSLIVKNGIIVSLMK